MARIFRFLREHAFVFVMPILGIAGGTSVVLVLSGALSAEAATVIQLAWILIAMLAVVGMFWHWHRSTGYRDTLDDAMRIVEQVSEYRHELLEKIAIYSKMANNGVPAPVANAIVSFAQNIKDTSTLFMIRLSHDEGAWYLHVAGQPVHLDQALFVMDMAKYKIRSMASDKGFIFKKREGVIN